MSYLVDLTHRIGGQDRPGDALLAALAAAQHGVVATWQVYLLGFTARAVERRLQSGRLHSKYRGVYAVGHAKLTVRGHWMAAVLAFGEHALLSHRSAAALRNLLPDARAVIDVTVPGRSRKGLTGVVLHQPRSLHPADIDVVDGIPTTSVARLLLDVAETYPRGLPRIFEAAERERVLDLRTVHELIERSHGRAGLSPLNALLEQCQEPPPHTRSELEQRFFGLLREAGLPLPSVNAWVGEYEVDMLWREQKLVVELDGWEFHRTRQAFERDRARIVRLQLMGHRVLPFTWRKLASEPHFLLAAVQRSIDGGASFALS